MEKGKPVEMSLEELDAIKAIEGAVETLKKHRWHREAIREEYEFTETLCRKSGGEGTRRYISVYLQWLSPPEKRSTATGDPWAIR